MAKHEIPLLFPEEFNDGAAQILRAAETIIYEECCANACVHVNDGGHLDTKVNRPSWCRFMQVSDSAPLECAAYACKGDA